MLRYVRRQMAEELRRVLVNREALIFRRGRICSESFVPGSRHAAHYDTLSRRGWFLIKNYWLRRGAVPVPSGLWAIDNYSPDSYHHWMIDVLPRILRAEESHPDERVLLLPRYYERQPYIGFTLRAFPRIERVGWIGARTKVRVERLVLVPRQRSERLTAQIVEVARRVGALAGPPGTARRIYFGREDARRRRARNERDVVRELRRNDVEVVRIDPAKPWEQVRASMGARLIVGVHGAALTNLIFMPPGARLLELRHGHDEVFFDAYRPLAEALGIEYRRVTCDLAEEARGLAINDTDIVVDLEVLRENLRDAPDQTPVKRRETGR
jgi:capsular polysaccharide biosynthesis protein